MAARRDGKAERQPIWLTETDENPNGADYAGPDRRRELGAVSAIIAAVCDMFDGGDETAVDGGARSAGALAKAAGHALTYWQQTGSGWEESAGRGLAEFRRLKRREHRSL